MKIDARSRLNYGASGADNVAVLEPYAQNTGTDIPALITRCGKVRVNESAIRNSYSQTYASCTSMLLGCITLRRNQGEAVVYELEDVLFGAWIHSIAPLRMREYLSLV